ncbi:MAG: metalloregulator ArsR/SmtB family transcription factor [Thaumarchaeota archaeon]|nr:metalloregulator ArsR/SmtB family transcription factor [Nitrososphaerota archaeon]
MPRKASSELKAVYSKKYLKDLHSGDLDLTFSALGDPTRRHILAILSKGTQSVTELAKPFSISLPAISKHLDVLEKAGLIVRERKGKFLHCHLNATPLARTAGWIANYKSIWEKQLDFLDDYLTQERKSGK